MFQILKDVSYEEMQKVVVSAAKFLIVSVFLMCFAANLVVGNKAIPFCDEQWEELANDMADWRERCWIEETGLINSECCNAEYDYMQERAHLHKQMCFYDGKNISILS